MSFSKPIHSLNLENSNFFFLIEPFPKPNYWTCQFGFSLCTKSSINIPFPSKVIFFNQNLTNPKKFRINNPVNYSDWRREIYIYRGQDARSSGKPWSTIPTPFRWTMTLFSLGSQSVYQTLNQTLRKIYFIKSC